MPRYIDAEPLEKLGYLALVKVVDNYRFSYSPLCEIPRADVAEVVHAYPIFDKKHNEAMCSNCKSYTIEYDVDKKIVSSDGREFVNDWLSLTTGDRSKYLFCKKCADVFWKTMFNCDTKYGAEQIVRCKDCKHATMTSDGKMCKYCEMDTDGFGDQREVYHDADWFCADGERKEDEKNEKGL